MKINLQNNINNVSIQIGDMAYYITPTNQENINGTFIDLPNGFVVQNQEMVRIGEITSMGNNSVTVDNPVCPIDPVSNDFIMFSKNKSANNTSLLGYYAEVKLINDSTEEAELFALSSEVTSSSK